MRNCYLWSNVVFEKEVISHLILKDFRPERLQPFIMQMKANKFVQQWCFFLHHSLATSMTNWESKFHRFVILCLGYTKENTGLWQLSKVSNAFLKAQHIHVAEHTCLYMYISTSENLFQTNWRIWFVQRRVFNLHWTLFSQLIFSRKREQIMEI